MKKQEIDATDFYDWLNDNWILYAAYTIRSGKRLRLYANMVGRYRVYLNEKLLYDGSQMTHALSAYNNAPNYYY